MSTNMNKVRPSTKASSPPPTMDAPGPLPVQSKGSRAQLGQTAGADTGSHISDPIRSELGKLHPEQAAQIRRVASSK
jgi:hypothetical protein